MGHRLRPVLGRTGVRRTLVAGLLLLVPVFLWHRCGVAGCPSVDRLVSFQPGGASVLLDREGNELTALVPVQREVVALSSLPDHVSRAFVAVEDRRFFRHRGIDWIRVGGAGVANVRAGGVRQGSSTITMQVARNVFPERIRAGDRTFRRKILEARVARDIERRFSKDQILELYLNHIYFGGGAYGIEAASRAYFGHPASELTLSQAATLAALPKAPTHYDPRRSPERSRVRRDVVLALMVDQGLVDPGEAERARSRPTAVTPSPPARRVTNRTAGSFVQAVRALLEQELGDDLYSRPLRIHTTLDPTVQRATEEELERQLRRVESGGFGRYEGPRMAAYTPAGGAPAYVQGAAVVLDPLSGEVRAMVGGRNLHHSSFNRAVQARRQAGSAFKPFVYAAALSGPWSPSDRLDDSPFRLAVSGDETWEPGNIDGRFVGPITVREALVQSRNVPTVRLIQAVGEGDVARLARAAGIRGDVPRSPVSALGVTEVSPLELTAAYAVFASGGSAVPPRLVTRVETADGEVVWVPRDERRAVLRPGVAYLITDMLREVVDRGTGRGVRTAGFQGPAAGKTGTTNGAADAWFVGYTPGLLAGVWIGFDLPRPIAPGATGGTVAAEVWGRLMTRVDTSRAQWSTPASVAEVMVDPASGLVLRQGCRPLEGEPRAALFLRDRVPRDICPAGEGASWFRRFATWVGEVRRREQTPVPHRAAPEPSAAPRVAAEEGDRRERDAERSRRDFERETERQRRELERAARRLDRERRQAGADLDRAAEQVVRELQQRGGEVGRTLRQVFGEGLDDLLSNLAADIDVDVDTGDAEAVHALLSREFRRLMDDELAPVLRELEQMERRSRGPR